jgi:hypothetical protein
MIAVFAATGPARLRFTRFTGVPVGNVIRLVSEAESRNVSVL